MERGRALVWVACVGILSASRKIVARSCAQLSRVRSHTIPPLRVPVATQEAVPTQRAHTSVRPRGPPLPSLKVASSASFELPRDDDVGFFRGSTFTFTEWELGGAVCFVAKRLMAPRNDGGMRSTIRRRRCWLGLRPRNDERSNSLWSLVGRVARLHHGASLGLR